MKRRLLLALVFVWGLLLPTPLLAQPEQPEEGEEEEKAMSAGTFAGLTLRSIGPALMSGRVGDFAVNPRNHKQYFVAVCFHQLSVFLQTGGTESLRFREIPVLEPSLIAYKGAVHIIIAPGCDPDDFFIVGEIRIHPERDIASP